jgi:hypothetical protein
MRPQLVQDSVLYGIGVGGWTAAGAIWSGTLGIVPGTGIGALGAGTWSDTLGGSTWIGGGIGRGCTWTGCGRGRGGGGTGTCGGGWSDATQSEKIVNRVRRAVLAESGI